MSHPAANQSEPASECERVLSRETKGTLIAEKQSIQHWIADSWVQIQQFRLQVLHCAWLIG